MQELAITFVTIWLFCEIIRLYVMMKSSSSMTAEKNPPTANGTKPTKKGAPPAGAIPSVLCRRTAGSNWQRATEAQQATAATSKDTKKTKNKNRSAEKWTKFVAMDCEMVGYGINSAEDMLARVSIVNQMGDVLIDKYVKQQEEVTDYRTSVSGIRPRDMVNGEDFAKVQNEVMQILRDKVLVGHSINHDLAVLRLKHPQRYIRDTAKYRPLAKLVSNGATPSLKRLAKAILGMDIQGGEHDSVEDARVTMLIYVRFSAEWERYIKKQQHRTNARSGRHRS